MAANNKKLSERLDRLTDERVYESFNPLHYPVSLSRPLRKASSFWTQHIPFAMFLIDLLKPRTVVELGTFRGASYCAFCQAVKELNLDTRCYAVDNWEGDPHNGFYDQGVFEDLKLHHDPLYGSFSRLIRSDFEDALSYFRDGSIDLLHIDGYHTYEAVSRDFANWLPKLSDQAVVLLHDIETYERDFGVWRFWQELKAKYPCFEFKHGYGLGLVAPRRAQPAPIRQLLNATEYEQRLIREFFFRLGDDLESKLKHEEQLLALSANLHEKELLAQSLAAQLADREMELARITSSLGWRILSRYGRIKYKYLMPVYRLVEKVRPAAEIKGAIHFGLDAPLPESLKVGKANALFISGWCFHTTRKIDRLEVIIEGNVHPVKTMRQARRDILDIFSSAIDPNGHSYRSGFWTIMKMPRLDQNAKVTLKLRATLRDGRECLETMGAILLNAED